MSSHEASSTHDTHAEPRSKSSMSASFWFVIILVGLFVAALNFIQVTESSSHSNGHVNKEATSNQTLHGESGLGKPETAGETTGEGAAKGITNDTLHTENAAH